MTSPPPSVPTAPSIEVAGPPSVVGRNVTLLFGDRVLRLAVGLVVNVWIVRYLGPEGLGLLGFAQSLVALAAVAADIGLESILIRELVRRPAEAPRLLATAALMRLCGSAVAIALAVAVSAGLRPGDATAMVVVLVLASSTAFQAMDVVGFWFQSQSRFGPFLIARGTSFLVATAVKIVCLIQDAGLAALAAAIALESCLSAFTLAAAYRAAGGSWKGWRPRRDEALYLWRASWPLALNGLALVTAARLDQVLLTQLRGVAENGVYSAAQRLFEILYFIPTGIAAAAAPGLIRAHAESPVRYRDHLAALMGRLFWGAVGLAVTISLLAGPIVSHLFGVEYQAAATVLSWLVWAAPAAFLGIAQSNWFIVEGRTTGLLLRSVVAAVAVLILDMLLIPRHGAIGAALAVVIAQALAHVGVNAFDPAARPLLRLQAVALVPRRWQ